jgi:hypothetical protein
MPVVEPFPFPVAVASPSPAPPTKPAPCRDGAELLPGTFIEIGGDEGGTGGDARDDGDAGA